VASRVSGVHGLAVGASEFEGQFWHQPADILAVPVSVIAAAGQQSS
jgi:hypothetical protein